MHLVQAQANLQQQLPLISFAVLGLRNQCTTGRRNISTKKKKPCAEPTISMEPRQSLEQKFQKLTLGKFLGIKQLWSK